MPGWNGNVPLVDSWVNPRLVGPSPRIYRAGTVLLLPTVNSLVLGPCGSWCRSQCHPLLGLASQCTSLSISAPVLVRPTCFDPPLLVSPATNAATYCLVKARSPWSFPPCEAYKPIMLANMEQCSTTRTSPHALHSCFVVQPSLKSIFLRYCPPQSPQFSATMAQNLPSLRSTGLLDVSKCDPQISALGQKSEFVPFLPYNYAFITGPRIPTLGFEMTSGCPLPALAKVIERREHIVRSVKVVDVDALVCAGLRDIRLRIAWPGYAEHFEYVSFKDRKGKPGRGALLINIAEAYMKFFHLTAHEQERSRGSTSPEWSVYNPKCDLSNLVLWKLCHLDDDIFQAQLVYVPDSRISLRVVGVVS
ncbi:hypothetical protein C2E23DRAFT_136083 [Lenzites betulinus]|nr:hypothetical protein C2E23DRAFT_136083 [Lenzites betulinus]